MNILVTLNKGYVKVLAVMLKSLLLADRDNNFDVYVMNTSLTAEDFDYLNGYLSCDRLKLIDIKADNSMLAQAPVTDRYPLEMYYRIFAASFLPADVDRVLYLDPDLVVLKPLDSLYNTDMGDNFFAAASHVGNILTKVNNLRLNTEDNSPYINSGVMLMNIEQLRKEQDYEQVLDYIDRHKAFLLLPDQDVISALYSDRIIKVDPLVYNMTERLLLHPDTVERGVDMAWIAQNTAIIHFCGRNKPWKPGYTGMLGYIYHYISAQKTENL